jgi:c-di-AMP phosphodiesterase-like protein
MKFQKEIGFVFDTRKKAYILKFRNYDSYLFGPEQLIYFQDIRDALKYQKHIEIVVKYVDQTEIDTYFPPLFNFTENQKHEMENIETAIFKKSQESSGVYDTHSLN